MFWLRCLVLLGLCLTSAANATVKYWVTGYPAYFGATPQQGCTAYANYLLNSGYLNATAITASETTCNYTVDTVVTYGQPAQPVIRSEPISAACVTHPTTDLNGTTSIWFRKDVSAVLYLFNGGSAVDVPANQCIDRCQAVLNTSKTASFAAATTDGTSLGSIACSPANAAIGSTVTCSAFFDETTTLCGTPTTNTVNIFHSCPSGQRLDTSNNSCKLIPTCTAPQQLNAQFICESPACPTGQVRETALGLCKPIVCTAPLQKVGNECQIPSCPTGETYEYTNGIGSCVKNAPLCQLPQTLVNGICKSPTCATGMMLHSSGSCIPNPLTNPNTSAGSGSGTGTGTGTGGGTTGTSGGGGAATGITGSGGGATAGGTTAGAGTGTSGGSGSGGTSTNTSKSGTCTTAPCGECDPTKETCGNTFGGSCKSGFKCNGDAIQCAVAQATNKAECLLKSLYVETQDNLIYNEGKTTVDAGTKALGTTGGIQVQSGGAITIDSNNPFSSSCPADMPLFTYKSQQYMLPLGQYCNIFQIMGNIMLLCASLIALKIIMKVE